MSTCYKKILTLGGTLALACLLHANSPLISSRDRTIFFSTTPLQEKVLCYGNKQPPHILATKITTTIEKWYDCNAQSNVTLNNLVDSFISHYKRNTNKQTALAKKNLVIFDIDETVLSNYKIFCTNIKTHTSTSVAQAINTVDPKDLIVLNPLKRLYQFFIQQQCTIVFLTARYDTDVNRQQCIQQLTFNGFDIFHDLYMRPSSWKDSIASFKESIRTQLAQSFTIIATIDDDWRNLQGKHVGKYALWVPNPLEKKPGEDSFYQRLLKAQKYVPYTYTKRDLKV